MKWMFFLVSLAFVSCKPTVLEKTLLSSNEVTIVYGSGSGVPIRTNDRGAIKKLTRFIDTRERASLNCEPEGLIQFLKDGELVQEVQFSYSKEGCRQFSFVSENKQVYTKLNSEAADFFKSLKSEERTDGN